MKMLKAERVVEEKMEEEENKGKEASEGRGIEKASKPQGE